MSTAVEFQELGDLGGTSGNVSGDIYVPSEREADGEEEDSTLDEPVTTTLKRDLKAILRKCFHILLPLRANKTLLHDWDLWGPLLLCVTTAILLHGHTKLKEEKSSTDSYNIHFIQVFLLFWGGAAVVTVNAQLLRGKVSFFQSVCTLGYCLLPLTLALLVSRILLISSHRHLILILRFSFTTAAIVWSSWASLGFLSDYLPTDRRFLAVYPIVLFYFGIGCLILAQNQPLV